MNQVIKTKPAPTFVDYLKDKKRCVDFMNYFLFDGQPILNENHLYDYDSDSSTVFYTKHEIASIGKSRDIIMKARIGNQFALIGIELQQAIDYSMPYRTLMYDVISYNQQYNRQEVNEKKHFHPMPTITFVLYSGERRWNRPRTFAELIKVPSWLEGKFNDWRSYIFDIKDIDVQKLHHPDNRKLVEAVQRLYRWNKDITCLSDMVMSKEVAILVATIINQEKLVGNIEKRDEEEIDMCTAITEALLENWKEGELTGERIGMKQGERIGMKQGERIGKTTMLITLLKSKLGGISKKTEKDIETISDEQLDYLAVHIFDVYTEEDILKMIS